MTGPYAHGLFQEGAAKVRLPKDDKAVWPEAVLINTAGGLTGGDRFVVDIACEAKTAVTVTTQAAEKVYRSLGSNADFNVNMRVSSGALLEWLPQETILFDGGRLRRETIVHLAKNAQFLGLEAMVFGRTAMGEAVRGGFLHDRWRVHQQGALVFSDDTRLDGAVQEMLNRPFAANAHRAVATLVSVSPNAGSLATKIQALAPSVTGLFGASAWDDVMVARFLNVTGQKLRSDLTLVLEVIRDGRALPKVWSC